MVWAVDAVQSDRSDVAARYLHFPVEAATSDIDAKLALRKWELETLIGQLLVTPERQWRKDGPNYVTNYSLFLTGAAAVKHLRQLENSESGIDLRRSSVWMELQRIGHRQFPWQREAADRQRLYRYVYIYGQGECADYFARTYRVTVNQFSLIGFALYSMFQEQPSIQREDRPSS
jgi:hypothetical protein